MNEARVAVIIPAYNSAAFLGQAIESALGQTYPNSTVVVSDDNSQDDSAAIARAYPQVQLLQNPVNLGGPLNRNRAAQITAGDFLAFLDADDLWLPEKIALQMEMFAADPQLDLALTHVEQFFDPPQAEQLAAKYHLPHGYQPGYIPSAVLIRRSAFEAIGGFTDGHQIGDTLAFFLRALENDLRVAVHPAMLTRRRIHSANFSTLHKDQRQYYPRLLKASLDNRRRSAQKSAAERNTDNAG